MPSLHRTYSKVNGEIYLGYLLHYVAHWPVTAADLRAVADGHGFKAFAGFFGGLPKTTEFSSPEDIRKYYHEARAGQNNAASAHVR